MQIPTQKTFTEITDIIKRSEGVVNPHELQKDRDVLSGHFAHLISLVAYKEMVYESAHTTLKAYVSKEIIKKVMPVNRAKSEIEASYEYEKMQIDLIKKKYDLNCYKNIVKAIDKKLDSLSSAIRLAEKEEFHSRRQV